MQEYHKIQSIFKRDRSTNNFIIGEWSLPEFEFLQNARWFWDEKIDGTNIRIGFKGENEREFGGRTSMAQIPAKLYARLEELFPVEKLREVFGFVIPEHKVTLYGEGFGAKIQSGGAYIPDGVDFILFDVKVGDWWLKREDVEQLAARLGVRVTPYIGVGTINEAIEYVKKGFKSQIGTAEAEGLILRPTVQLFNRQGHRIITKIKTKDFKFLSAPTLSGE